MFQDQFKGTEGDWKLVEKTNEDNNANWQCIENEDSEEIAEFPCYKGWEGEYPEVLANAKLMVSSKKLLEALQLVQSTQAYKNYIQGGSIDKTVQEALKQAL